MKNKVIFKSFRQYTLTEVKELDKIFDKIDIKMIEKFESSVKEELSKYLINSANKQGLIDNQMKDYIIKNI